MVMPGDNVTMTIELIQPIAMEQGSKFAIREGGRNSRRRHDHRRSTSKRKGPREGAFLALGHWALGIEMIPDQTPTPNA